jgi:hypothetical protein
MEKIERKIDGEERKKYRWKREKERYAEKIERKIDGKEREKDRRIR